MKNRLVDAAMKANGIDYSSPNTVDLVLAHHGIKGQKWGVRRTKAQLGYKTNGKKHKKTTKQMTSTARGKKVVKKAKDGVKKKSSKKKSSSEDISKLSNEELRKRTERLRLEAEYMRLAPKPKKGVGKRIADAAVNDVLVPALKESGKKALSAYAQKKLGEALGVSIGKEQQRRRRDDD